MPAYSWFLLVFWGVHFGEGIAFILLEFSCLRTAEKFKSLVLELGRLTIDEADQERVKQQEARVTRKLNNEEKNVGLRVENVLNKVSGNYNT